MNVTKRFDMGMEERVMNRNLDRVQESLINLAQFKVSYS